MSSPSFNEKEHDDVGIENRRDVEADLAHAVDEEFGDHEARQKLEKKLLRKLDARMSILIVIYILNYVSNLVYCSARTMLTLPRRLTGIMHRMFNCYVR